MLEQKFAKSSQSNLKTKYIYRIKEGGKWALGGFRGERRPEPGVPTQGHLIDAQRDRKEKAESGSTQKKKWIKEKNHRSLQIIEGHSSQI